MDSLRHVTAASARGQDQPRLFMCCLIVGVEHGIGAPYPDTPAARQALDRFRERAGLPHPSVTDEGAALEVLWFFDPAVEGVPWARYGGTPSDWGQHRRVPPYRVLQIVRPLPELAVDRVVTGDELAIWHFAEGQDLEEPYPIVLIAESDRQELTALQATISRRAWRRIVR